MPYIRILRHYVHAPVVWMSVTEGIIAAVAAYFGFLTRYQTFPNFLAFLPSALTFGLVAFAAMTAMGVYESRVREGMLGMALRTAVAIFLLAIAGNAILFYLIPVLEMGRGVLFFSAVEVFLLLTIFRWIFFSIANEDLFKVRVLVLGTGHRAKKLAARMRRRYDQRAFHLLGFMALAGSTETDQVSPYGATVIHSDLDIPGYCREYQVDEVVVAMDERRRNLDAAGGLPLDQLIECRLYGVNVCEIQQFIEREASKVDVDLLRPSWVVFSEGFVMTPSRAITKRLFDLVASSVLLLFTWPVMILISGLVKLETPHLPVLYRQQRVGLDGKVFNVVKFRSMRPVKDQTPAWTQQNDPRITRIGALIRKSHFDELPQLFTVLRGDMSFVGPRPERPVFVEELREKIPFYNQRHRVKPGITGWAQLCYPYGASVDDAKEKLQYDLYYLKNHSLLLDMIILLQTAEVVLIGKGAR